MHGRNGRHPLIAKQWPEQLVAALPLGIWRWVGPRLAGSRRLAWSPGWRFGPAEASASALGRLRLALWQHAAARRLQISFAIRWYEGLHVTVHLGNDLSLCLFVGGAYEPNEFMFLAQVLDRSMVFIDVGANDGLYTLFAAKRVGPTGRVVALEPSRREQARLQGNLRLNGVTNVVALPVAAADRDGRAELKIAGFGHEGQNTLGGFAYPIEGAGVEVVEVARLDRIVSEQGLDRVDVLKIDAEGAEVAVLRGGRAAISKHRPLIILELLDAALARQGTSRHDLLEVLTECGYRMWSFGASGVPEPVDSLNLDGVNIIAAPREHRLIGGSMLPPRRP